MDRRITDAHHQTLIELLKTMVDGDKEVELSREFFRTSADDPHRQVIGARVQALVDHQSFIENVIETIDNYLETLPSVEYSEWINVDHVLPPKDENDQPKEVVCLCMGKTLQFGIYNGSEWIVSGGSGGKLVGVQYWADIVREAR